MATKIVQNVNRISPTVSTAIGPTPTTTPSVTPTLKRSKISAPVKAC